MPASARVKDQKAERPSQLVTSALQVGDFVHTIRAGLEIRQEELAYRAHVSRQWIGALERGKPSLEIGMVLRTLETLGFEISLVPCVPIPPWIVAARHESDRRKTETALRRNRRRRSRREAARLRRLAENATGIVVDID